MRIWVVALILGSAAGLYSGAVNFTREFAPHRIAQGRFYDGHYETYFHRTADGQDVLMALDHKKLNLIKFDIKTNTSVAEEKLVHGGRAPELVQTLSARSGEFWVAFARASRRGYTIDLHSDSKQEYFSIEEPQLPLSLALVEADNQILLIASYAQSVIIFGRKDGQLEQIAEIAAPSPLRRTQAFSTSQGSVIVTTFGEDKLFRVYDLDRSVNRLKERWRQKLGSGYIDATLSSADEIVVAWVQSHLKKGDTVRFLRERSKKLSAPQAIDLTLGTTQWVTGENGELYLAALGRNEDRPEVRLLNSQGAQFSTYAGDAQLVSGISAFSVGEKPFVAFLKNQRDVYLQGESATSVVRAPEDAKSVRLTPTARVLGGRQVIAVLTDLERRDPEAKNIASAAMIRSTRVQVIAFSRARSNSDHASGERRPKN